MTIALANTTRRVLVVLLTHGAYCERVGRCGCSLRRDGTRLPAALTLPARETVRRLDDTLLRLAPVIAAVRAGDVHVTHEVSAVVPDAPPSIAEPPGLPEDPTEPRRPERRPDQSRRGAR